MAQLSLQLLGPLKVTLDGQIVTGFESDKARALLIYLAIEADRPQERDRLTTLLWPDLSEKAQHNNLRGVLANLRHVLGDDTKNPQFLVSTASTIQFKRTENCWIDVLEFLSLLHKREHHLHHNPDKCLSCIQWLGQAIELYRGEFLAQFSLPEAEKDEDVDEYFNTWMSRMRLNISQRAIDAFFDLTNYHERRGHYDLAYRHALRQLELESWREEAHRQTMRILFFKRQRSAAIVQYQRCRSILRKELGLEPSEETTALYETIRSNTLDIPPVTIPSTNLPIPLTSFIGRDQEVTILRKWLLRDEIRLITLIGTPGVGKTRLSLQVAQSLRGVFEDGVFLVNLAPVRDHQLVLTAIAQVLGVQEIGSQPLEKRLKDYVQNKQTLLILDNFEHVLEAAIQVFELLKVAPELRVIVTSRKALNLSGEHELPVLPLSLPDVKHLPVVEHIAQYDAVALFCQRTQAVQPSFILDETNATVVAEICNRLDGLPLAIELAAIWSKLFSPQILLTKLSGRLNLLTAGQRDLPLRQQTLRNTIDWSYDLLGGEEQRLFVRLGIFVGSYTAEAVEAICNTVGDLKIETKEGLNALVEKSLLRREDSTNMPRFMMLETIREYAVERLDAGKEAEMLRQAHASYYLSLAEQAEQQLAEAQQNLWLDQLEQSHDNLRAALAWTIERKKKETSIRLVGALWRFWYIHGYLSEARKWLESALAQSQRLPATMRAKALLGAGVMAMVQGDRAQASKYFSESLKLYQRRGDKHGIASALERMAGLKTVLAEYKEAVALYEKSLALYRELGNKERISAVRYNRGLVAFEQGDLTQARACFEESFELDKMRKDKGGIANSLWALGIVLRDQKDLTQASRFLDESIVLFRELGDKRGIANSLNDLGEVVTTQGNYDRAATIYQESLDIWQEIGYKAGQAYALGNLGNIAYLQGDYGRATTLYKQMLTILNELEGKRGIARSMDHLAAIAMKQGRLERTTRLGGAAYELRKAIGASLPPIHGAEWEEIMAAARAQLGTELFDALWMEGRTMPLEQAINYALEKPQDGTL